jgi:DNA-binding SARP family transcriptional activator/TolB-like protein
VRLRVFGGLCIESGTGEVLAGAAARRRPLALLAVLAATPLGCSRDRLALLFWPDSDADHARNALNQALFALRRDLRAPELVSGGAELRLNPAAIASDVADFDAALHRGQPERAVTFYSGPFLDGVHLKDAPEFERWVETERERRARQASEVLRDLAREAMRRGDHEVSASWWRSVVNLDPLDERVAMAYMQSLVAAGDTAGALRHARVHESLLRSELQAEPGHATRAFVERLRTPDNAHASRLVTMETGLSRAPETRSPQIVSENGEHAEPPPPPPPDDAEPAERETVPRGRRYWAYGAGAVGVLGLAALAVEAVHRRSTPALDPTLIAVAPFDVLDPTFSLPREGMTNVLSRALDGMGGLHTVPTTRVARRWQGGGSADRESAVALGRSTGAGFVVVGTVVRAGPESLRVTARVVDVPTGRMLAEVVRREAITRMDRLTDSVAAGLAQSIGTRDAVLTPASGDARRPTP